MKYLLLVFALVLLFLSSMSQVIPENRRVNWEAVIDNIIITQPNNKLDVKDFGAVGDGITDDHYAIENAISALNGSHGYIYFPPGKYLITKSLYLPDSCILMGESSNKTTLLFNLNGEAANCIILSKSQSSDFNDITGGLDMGNNLITVQDVSSFHIGDVVEIRQKNGDWDVVPIAWADYSVGQITRIKDIYDDNLLLESPLRINYSADLDPEIRPINTRHSSGIQCLKIHRVDEPAEGAGANIYMNMAENCFVRGVESDTSVGAHISVNSSLNILIDGNYFHHAFKYDGVGMHGYGVALSKHTSECLITNNIFRYLRHAMMIKTGSNGNIFSYNYSIEPHRSEPIPDASGDISFHGHYAFSNLWEGNIVQNIIIDHYWGPSGPFNTLFRNRAELYGIIMTTSDLIETNSQNFVGNEVTNTEFLHGMYSLSGTNNFEFGNNILGEIIPTGTNNLPDQSYYLSNKPNFWIESLEWPSVGIPIELGAGTIPAEIRFNTGDVFTVCPDSSISSVNNQLHELVEINIWPNPAVSAINISFSYVKSSSLIQIINLVGDIVLEKKIQNNHENIIAIPVKNLMNGYYIVVIENVYFIKTEKLIISR